LDEGRKREFYPGVVNDFLSITNPDETEQFVIQINPAGLIETEGYHYVSLVDINAAPHHKPGENKERAFQHWRVRQDPNRL
jgi:hypothetical protein